MMDIKEFDPTIKIKNSFASCLGVDNTQIICKINEILNKKTITVLVYEDSDESEFPHMVFTGAFIDSFPDDSKGKDDPEGEMKYVVMIGCVCTSEIEEFFHSKDGERDFTQKFILELYVRQGELQLDKSYFAGTVGKELGIAYIQVSESADVSVGIIPKYLDAFSDLITELIRNT